jgi:hypothetical protein
MEHLSQCRSSIGGALKDNGAGEDTSALVCA